MFVISFTVVLQSKRGEMTPHLFMRPVSWTTIFPERWSSSTSNSPIYPAKWMCIAVRMDNQKLMIRLWPFCVMLMLLPFFCITCRNLTTTFEEGLRRTCLLPRFSAFDIVFRQSASADILVILIEYNQKNNHRQCCCWLVDSSHKRLLVRSRWSILFIFVYLSRSWCLCFGE